MLLGPAEITEHDASGWHAVELAGAERGVSREHVVDAAIARCARERLAEPCTVLCPIRKGRGQGRNEVPLSEWEWREHRAVRHDAARHLAQEAPVRFRERDAVCALERGELLFCQRRRERVVARAIFVERHQPRESVT